MKKFEILEHPADLKVKAFGRDKQELFENMLKGMQQALRPVLRERKAATEIRLEAEDNEALLIDFLSEINYLNDINQEIYQQIKFKRFFETEIEAELLGRKVKRFGLEIKGVTWHDLKIFQDQSGIWQAAVLFDI